MTDTPPPETPKLTPANENPWYCLMTLHGEQPDWATPWNYDEELHAKNRRDWNKWAARALTSGQRFALLSSKNSSPNLDFSDDELDPHHDSNLKVLGDIFKNRTQGCRVGDLPSPAQSVELDFVRFDAPVIATGFLFPNSIIFDGAIFLKFISFEKAYFNDYISLKKTVFSMAAWIENSVFAKLCTFENSIFISIVNFSGSIFFEFCYFSGANFSGSSNFSNTTFKRAISFEKATFETTPPNFHEATLHSDTNWLDTNWPPPPTNRSDAADHVRNYQRLKQIMDNLKKHEDELRFFSREMRAQRTADGGWTSPRGLLNGLYSLTSNYGRKIALPLAWMAFLIWAAFAALVWTQECPLDAQKLCADSASWHPLGIGKSLGLAITSAISFLPLKKDIFGDIHASLSTTAHVIMSVEAILCFALLFLAGLGLRNRFRMK